MHLGILKTGHAPEPLQPQFGDYDAVFSRFLANQGFTFSAWDVVDLDFPNSIDAADGWLLTGSRHGAYEDEPFIAPLEQFVRGVFSAGIPLVGICFGHQLIAQALGGTVEKSSKGWGVGRQAYAYDGGEICLNAWHQDQVVAIPEGAQIIARNPFCEYAALLYGKRALTYQAHPEIGTDMLNGLIETRGKGVVPDNRLDYARSQLSEPLDNQRIADDIAAFFHASYAASKEASI